MTSVLSKSLKAFIQQNVELSESSAWRPSADIYRQESEWMIKIELAGIKLDELKIISSGSSLKLEGVRKDRPSNRHSAHTMEIAYNHFERIFEFSSNIENIIGTEYKDGMLYISLRTGDPL